MIRNQMIKTAAAVPSLKVADTEFNTEQIIRMMRENAECGLIVFPELCITGYTCGDLFGSKVLLDEAEKALDRIARASAGLDGQTVVVGLPVRYENCLYNCAAVVSGGEIAGIIPKEHIPSYAEFYEGRWFTSGKDVIGRTLSIGEREVPFGIDVLAEDPSSGAVISAEIGEDLFVPERPGMHAALAGANIIAGLHASDEVIGRAEYRRDLVRTESRKCSCAYLYVSSAMDESSTDAVFSGHALIAENGHIRNETIFSADTVVTAVVDVSRSIHERLSHTTFVSSDNAWYRRVLVRVKPLGGEEELSASALAGLMKKENMVPDRFPFVPEDDEERGRRSGRILQIQAHSLATRLRATGIRNLVLGISGGLDSTLALIVCHEAKKIVDGIRIITYTMPNEGNTSGRTFDNATKLMDLLADEVHTVPIGRGVREHLLEIGHTGEYQGEGDVAYENAQARMRTYILMDAANLKNGLVVGTGDLSELALGWCTFNGDHMSMYAVNCSVPKTLVQYICRSYALNCGDPELAEVLFSILDTPITPELTPSADGAFAQKTEDKIGKYDLNDFFLYWHMRWGMEPQKILAFAMCAYPELEGEFIKDALVRFLKRFFTQQFKRNCVPDGPKVGSVGLSPRGDWRMPSDAAVNIWLKNLEEESI